MTMPSPQTMDFLTEAVAVRENFTGVVKAFAKVDAQELGLGFFRTKLYVLNKARKAQNLRQPFLMAVMSHSIVSACTSRTPTKGAVEILHDLVYPKFETLK